jgi:hypothetical protein
MCKAVFGIRISVSQVSKEIGKGKQEEGSYGSIRTCANPIVLHANPNSSRVAQDEDKET